MTADFKLIACTLAATALHALIFVGTAACLSALGSLDVGAVAWSHRYYYDYASRAMAGEVPYRDFAFEYPILSYPLFLLPRLIAANFEGYRVAFVAEMFLFDVGAIVLLAACDRENSPAGAVARRLGWYTLYVFLLAPLVIGRFELAPMALALAAALWWFSGRPAPGGVAAGLGALMKVFPGLVAVPALVGGFSHLRSTRGRGGAAFFATLATGLAIWLALGGGRAIESLGYHAERGLEVESLFGGILFLAGTITGNGAPWVFDHNSYHVASAAGALLALLTFPLQAVSLLAVAWRFRRTGMTEGLRFSAAAILAFITFGKVLSPQYLIWLFPFIAALSGRTGRLARRIFLLACLTTALLYPGPGFRMMLEHQLGAILLLNLRNILLLWLLGVLLLGPQCPGSDEGLPGDGYCWRIRPGRRRPRITTPWGMSCLDFG
jgi:hypothetical protein